LTEAEGEIRRVHDELTALDRARRNYLAQLRVFVERQLAEIAAAEAAPSPHTGRSSRE
jgi:hypothetical protein